MLMRAVFFIGIEMQRFLFKGAAVPMQGFAKAVVCPCLFLWEFSKGSEFSLGPLTLEMLM